MKVFLTTFVFVLQSTHVFTFLVDTTSLKRPRSPHAVNAVEKSKTTNKEPTESTNFGRQDYWNQVYKTETEFSWYAGWEEVILERKCEIS